MKEEVDLVLELPTDVGSIKRTVDLVMRQCARCVQEGEEMERRLRLNLRVGLTEALSNAMLYGNHRDPEKRVRLELCTEDEGITVRVIDEGEGFDPSQVPNPTTPVNVDKEDGRGIFLMRELLDEVRFNERGNCVTLVLRSGSGRELDGGARA